MTSLRDFQSIRLIGNGSYGAVWLVRQITGTENEYFAMKVQDKAKADTNAFKWQSAESEILVIFLKHFFCQ